MEWIRKIGEVELRYEELSQELAAPELLANPQKYRRAAKQHADIAAVVEKYRAWKDAGEQLEATLPLLDEPEAEIAAIDRKSVV